MVKDQLVRVQERARPRGATVEGVPRQGETQGGKLDPDLVGAPGFGAHFENGLVFFWGRF